MSYMKDSTGRRLDTFPAMAANAQGSSYLRTFKAALADAQNGLGACDILVIGDSISEGTGPTTIENRYASLLRDMLRVKIGQTNGGRGYVPSVYAATGATQLFALSGGASALVNGTVGLGRRGAQLTATGHTATLTVSGVTAVDLVASGGTGRGRFTYTVDGGSATTINTAQFGTVRDYFYSITGLSAGSHTIVITWLDTGPVYIVGAMLYNGDQTAGVRLWDGSHHGYETSHFANTADPWWKTVNTIQPDLVILALGVNNYRNGTSSPSAMSANLTTIISEIRNQTTIDPSIVLMPMYGPADSGTTIATWSAYVDAMRSLAQSDGDIAVLDLYKRMGQFLTSGDNALSLTIADLIHPTNKGARFIAQALYNFLGYEPVI